MFPSLLLLAACNSASLVPDADDPKIVPGTATRPIVDPVDSARDTGTLQDTEPPTDTAPTEPSGDTGPLPIDTGVHVLEGRAFQFNPNAVTIVAGGVPITLYETNFLVEVLDVNPITGTADLRVASFDPNTGGQAFCAPTNDVEGDFSANPELTFGPIDGGGGLFGKYAPIEQASGFLVFDPSYETIDDAQMTALWDIDTFASYYYGPGYGSSLCSLLGTYGGGCTTCPASGSSTCLAISATNAKARWDPGLSLVERTEADVQADPSCP